MIFLGVFMNDINEIKENYENWNKILADFSTRGYKKSIMGIVDILGFKNFVQKEKENSVKTVIEAIRDSIMLNKMAISTTVKYAILSDTIIVYSENVDSDNVFYVIHALGNLQLELLRHRFLCRGALVTAENYINNDIIVSEALIKAHLIEEKIAIYPRIIIDEEVFKIIKPQIDSGKIMNDKKYLTKDAVIRDYDGKYVLNTLCLISDVYAYINEDFKYFQNLHEDNNMKLYRQSMYEFKNNIQDYYVSVLKDGSLNKNILSKLNYLVNYYNRILNLSILFPKNLRSELYLAYFDK